MQVAQTQKSSLPLAPLQRLAMTWDGGPVLPRQAAARAPAACVRSFFAAALLSEPEGASGITFCTWTARAAHEQALSGQVATSTEVRIAPDAVRVSTPSRMRRRHPEKLTTRL